MTALIAPRSQTERQTGEPTTYQPMVEVPRRTESGAGPAGHAEKREHTGSM